MDDLVKLAMFEAVLLKLGRLNEQEWRQMHNHPAESALLVSPTLMNDLIPMILQHHERGDDGGYSYRLKGLKNCEEAVCWLWRMLATRQPAAVGGGFALN